MRPSPTASDGPLWTKTRAGARAGRGFRYQDAVGAWLAVLGWTGEVAWNVVVPEGLDDISLHGETMQVRAQLKSRHDPQARFGIAEVADYVAKMAVGLTPNDAEVQLAVVLERPVEGLAPAGWDIALGESGHDVARLRAELKSRMPDVDPDALLARLHLIVEPAPIDRAVELIIAKSVLLPAAARLVAHKLRERAGEAADTNYSRAALDAASLDATSVQADLDQIFAVIDPAGYDELTGGLCVLADFDAPLAAAGFYSGVDVQPGHVGAGLVFERPEATDTVLAALAAQRSVLVAGPSGAGKSAVAWLSAYSTRHIVRWYRIRRLAAGEVGRLAQLAQLLEASPMRPVGFVMDDVGRDATAGWDGLIREVRAHPGLLAIGTVREEDVLTLETGGQTRVVRPRLDEGLAERIFKALTSETEAAFAHWREPYTLSEGLLLEYTHLLTAGQRIGETLGEQVRRRLVEDRAEELLVLEVVALLSAHGGAADRARLQAVLGIGDVALAKALSRLVDEHALRVQADGSLQGLHEIRSQHLDAALRERLARPIGELCGRALAAGRAADFPTLLPRLLRAWPDAEEAVLDALAARMAAVDVEERVAILRGLGLATIDRIAAAWVQITRDLELDDRLCAFSFALEMADSDLDLPMFKIVRQAVVRFRALTFTDLRAHLFARLPEPPRPLRLDLADAHKLMAVSLPFRGCGEGPPTNYLPDDPIADAPLEALLAFLATAHEAGDVGRRAIAQAGGVDLVLERIWHETGWVTRPVRTTYDGQTAVASNLRITDDLEQTDLHGAAVAHCARLAAADPEAERLLCSVVTADGQVAGWGDFDVADLKMERRWAIDPMRIAWNRAHGRAIERLVAAETDTARETALASAVNELEVKLREAGDFYCRMESPPPQWRLFMQVRALLTGFVQPPSVRDVAPEGSEGAFRGDLLHEIVNGVQTLATQLVDPIERPLLVADTAAELLRKVDAARDAKAWRWTAEPPLAALGAIREHLADIVAVLEDTHVDAGRRHATALRLQTSSRKNSVLHRAGEAARERAGRDYERMRQKVLAACAARGWTVDVVARLPAGDKHRWPGVELGVFVSAASISDWLSMYPEFEAVSEAAGVYVLMSFILVRDDHAFPIACDWRGQMFPAQDPVADWETDSPFPFLMDEVVGHLTQVLEWIIRLSAMTADRDRELNSSEESAFERGVAALEVALDAFRAELESTADPDLAECLEIIGELVRRLDAEAKTPPKGRCLAAELQAIGRGETTELGALILACRVTLMERALRQRGKPNLSNV